ncbi:F-box protein At3g59000-like [Arabidopsis lyrata subsp. lyrata]|uniref:F-box protein At3g59000-like n=1 Tax=Arabidopsis lyrata subsp. lyrata TaxID=81972 RepID=UPI000A29ADEF|nr:F-box protein At3g59000-like [Arabidopsis lyrata subsp. lyrata]|eukprot:XP_020880533.1 F-box protein At3g59000-like [Arabidopsis lyrata subsp. lyrata]
MDLVSRLPDEVLCHILSFLTTKETALTSVLSKRWLNLWTLVPDLDIDDSVFLHPEEGKRDRPEIIQSFMDFVDRIISLQGNSPINKVSLKCQTGVDSDNLDFWIQNVLARGVSDLDLCIVFGDRYWLSSSGFESNKLVKLKIGSGIDLGWWTESIFLPMLKTLVLDSVEFCVDKFAILLPACPALEELDMANIKGLDSDETVSSASLKTLKIKSSVGSGTFSFDTPSLVYLGYSDSVAEDYHLANLQNLFEARINLVVTKDQIERARAPNNDWLEDDEDDVALRLGNVAKLMYGIRNVQKLCLTSSTLEVLSLCCESMPVFNNLKLLRLRRGESRWQAVPVLLKNCPHLDTLSIVDLSHCVPDTFEDVCDCISQEDKVCPRSTCPVKRLEIEGFRGTMREIKIIKHFLDYFPCLKEIEISDQGYGLTQPDVPEVIDLQVQMMKLYKKSLTCNVEIMVCESLYNKLTAQILRRT